MGEGLHSTEVAFLPRVEFSAYLRIFLLMVISFTAGTALNSGQRLDNVNQTHLALASDKLVLQKGRLLLDNHDCVSLHVIRDLEQIPHIPTLKNERFQSDVN